MQRSLAGFALLVFVLSSEFVVAEQIDRIQNEYQFSNPLSIQLRGPRGGGGRASTMDAVRPFIEQIAAAVGNGEALKRAAVEAGKVPVDSVVFVSPSEWKRKTSNNTQSDKLLLTVEPVITSMSTNDIILHLTIRFSHPIDQEASRSIMKRYAELVAPEAKKLSQQFFTEHFETAMAEVKKTKESAVEKVGQLETERRNLQLRSYEELPYEKVADHLADLQRQQLTLKLSLVGMDAKKSEIEKQLKIAELRLKDQAERTAKQTASNETVDALKQLVALREKNADRVKELNQAGIVATQSEVDEAATRVLETKIQLFAALDKKQAPAHNEPLDNLQAELTRLAIDRSEQQARLEYLAKMREEAQERIARRANIDQDIKRIDEQLPASKRALQTAETRVKELEDAKAAFKPIDLTKNDN
jgi:hypothetical protein